MKPRSVVDELHFEATSVVGHEQAYTEDFIVHGIYLEEGDPETGGQSWNFTRAAVPESEEDEGVCTVKEIQQVTVYNGIVLCELTRNLLTCVFDASTSERTGVRRLTIGFRVDDAAWTILEHQARRVFDAMPYFSIA